MSQLHDKINSYALERGIEFDQTFTTAPTRTGTNPLLANFTQNTTPNIVYEPTVGPIGGSGSWKFQWSTASATNSYFRAPTSSTTELLGVNDQDYSVGFWVKFNDLPTGTSVNAATLLQITNNSTGFNIGITGSSNANYPSQIFALNANGTVYSGTSVTTNVWYYIAVRRKSNTYTYYLNNSLFGTVNNTGTTAASTWMIGDTSARAFNGSYNISNYYLAPADTIGPTQIAEIWIAGTVTIVNKVITETPATATNAHLPEPVISTTTGVSFGTEPGTANAETFDPFIFGNANYEHSFAIASGLLTVPTLAFTFNDNTEVVTSITASAEFIEPFSFVGQTNISNAAQLMQASANIEQHTIITGRSISYPTELVGSASALAVEPLRFGPDDANISALPMIASNAVLQGQGSVTRNYFNIVKSDNPLLYAYGSAVNYGSSQPTTFVKDSGYSYANAGFPLSTVNDGNAYMLNDPLPSASNQQLTWTGQIVTDMKTIHTNRAFTYEYWFRPTNSGSWDSGSTSKQSVFGNSYFQLRNAGQTSTNATFQYIFSGETITVPSFNVAKSLLTNNVWHHWVVTMGINTSGNPVLKTYFDGNIINSATLSTYTTPSSTAINNIDRFQFNVANFNSPGISSYDEVAIYSTELTASDILDRYNFINTLSPNKILPADPAEADAIFPEPNVIRQENKNFPATPITGSALFVDASTSTQINLNFITTPATASALSVNPSFYGTPDYRKNAEPLTAFIEMNNNNFALDDRYYAYVNTNLTPYRYVTFDLEPEYQDYGTDADYFVLPTTTAGSVTQYGFGINNRSIKTAGIDFRQDGVILKESEWNDDWGTSTNNWHSSFWIQRAGDDQSSGTADRMVWNITGYKDNQYALLYHFNNKLWLQYNKPDPNQPFVETSSGIDINLFDYQKHHIAVVAQRVNNNNNYIRVYVDGTKVIDHNMGTYFLNLTNYTTSQPANSETYNHARLAVGAMITPWAWTGTQGPGTGLWDYPQSIKIYVDEIHWAQTTLTDLQVTNLYNAMPLKDNNEWYADFFLATNATLVNPAVGVGSTEIATVSTASAEIFTPTVTTQYELIFNATPLTASALSVNAIATGDNIRNVNFAADMMFASAILVGAELIISYSAQPMTATAKMPSSLPPWYDPYRALVIQQSITYPAGEFFGFKIGDIDE